jgi:hypothetical protein
MDCDYSQPVNYLGQTPSSSLEAYAFAHSHCTLQVATPSAPIATFSGTISAQVTFPPIIHQALTDTLTVGLMYLVLVAFWLGWETVKGSFIWK